MTQMEQLEQLETAVLSLPEEQYLQFRQWFLKRDWERWDRQIEADAEAGKLDFLVQEAIEAKRSSQLRDLD